MTRAEWNKIVFTVEDATKRHMLAARAHERSVFRLAEAKSDEAAKDAQASVAESDLRQAIMAYGEACARKEREGGTDEDRAEREAANGAGSAQEQEARGLALDGCSARRRS